MVITSAFQADDDGSIPFFRFEVKYMDPNKKEKLIATGWNVGSVQEFLDLTDEEVRLIDRAIDLRNLGLSPEEIIEAKIKLRSKNIPTINIPEYREEDLAQIEADLEPNE